MANMEKKMGKIWAILNDLGFEEGVDWDWLSPFIFKKYKNGDCNR